jgi:hypothetical protein
MPENPMRHETAPLYKNAERLRLLLRHQTLPPQGGHRATLSRATGRVVGGCASLFNVASVRRRLGITDAIMEALAVCNAQLRELQAAAPSLERTTMLELTREMALEVDARRRRLQDVLDLGVSRSEGLEPLEMRPVASSETSTEPAAAGDAVLVASSPASVAVADRPRPMPSRSDLDEAPRERPRSSGKPGKNGHGPAKAANGSS